MNVETLPEDLTDPRDHEEAPKLAWTGSPELDKWFEALAAAQGEMKNPPKNATATIRGTSKRGTPVEYELKYSSLDVILSTLRPVLSKHGLCITQPPDETEKGTAIRTILGHSSGQWMQSLVLIGAQENMKGYGAALTYLKRYSLCAICGIAGEDELDLDSIDDAPDDKATDAPPRPERTVPRDEAADAAEFAIMARADQIADQEGVSPEEGLRRAREEAA